MRTHVAGARSERMSVERAITLERVSGGCVSERVCAAACRASACCVWVCETHLPELELLDHVETLSHVRLNRLRVSRL